MTTITQRIIRPLIAVLLCCPMLAIAAGNTVINYSPSTDTLSLKTSDAYLDDVLTQLANKLDFKVVLEGKNIHRLVNFQMTGKTSAVLNKLIQPNSVILSQEDKPPHRVTNVILLPVGEKSPEMALREKMRKPPSSDNPEENAQRQALQERRIQRKMMGLGRNAAVVPDNNNTGQQ